MDTSGFLDFVIFVLDRWIVERGEEGCKCGMADSGCFDDVAEAGGYPSNRFVQTSSIIPLPRNDM
jgi:hypothetical protein